MQLLKESSADIILLETNVEKGAKIYGQVRFVPMNKSYSYSDINGQIHHAQAKDVMIAPGTNPHLFKELLSPKSPELYVGDGGW